MPSVSADLRSFLFPQTVGPAKSTTETAQRTDAQSNLRMGVVTAVTTAGITVAVGPQTITAAHLDSYAPAVGDAVALMAVSDSWLAMGRVVGPGNPTDFSAAAAAVGPSLVGEGFAGNTVGGTMMTTTGSFANVSSKYTIDYYHPQNHVIMVVMGVCFSASASTAVGTFLIFENTSATNVGFRRIVPGTTSPLSELVTGILAPDLGRPGGQQRQVVLLASSTGGTFTVTDGVAASARSFAFLLDLGDNSFMATK